MPKPPCVPHASRAPISPAVRAETAGDVLYAHRAREGETEETPEATQETPVRPRPEPIDPETATASEQTAYRFICKLVEDMGLSDVTVAMHPGTNDDMVITVDGKEAGVLIGHHGDTLDALQYLANLAANRKEEGEKREYARITVDVEDYRAKREDALRALARRKGCAGAQIQEEHYDGAHESLRAPHHPLRDPDDGGCFHQLHRRRE